MWENPAQCWWSHPWKGGPGWYRTAHWANQCAALTMDSALVSTLTSLSEGWNKRFPPQVVFGHGLYHSHRNLAELANNVPTRLSWALSPGPWKLLRFEILVLGPGYLRLACTSGVIRGKLSCQDVSWDTGGTYICISFKLAQLGACYIGVSSTYISIYILIHTYTYTYNTCTYMFEEGPLVGSWPPS